MYSSKFSISQSTSENIERVWNCAMEFILMTSTFIIFVLRLFASLEKKFLEVWFI